MKKRALLQLASTPARREPRIQHLSDLHLRYEGGVEEVDLRPPDLSIHGMFVNTTTHFPEGAVVHLRFRLTQSSVEVQTRCEVRYCLPGTGIGVEFVGLGDEAAHAIAQELKTFSRSRRQNRNQRNPSGKARKALKLK